MRLFTAAKEKRHLLGTIAMKGAVDPDQHVSQYYASRKGWLREEYERKSVRSIVM